MNKDEQKLLTIRQVAKKLNVSVATIRRYIKSKKLKASKIGRAYRIKELDFQRFIDPNSSFQNSNTGQKPQEYGKDPSIVLKQRFSIKVIPGINSMITEVLAEIAKDLKGIDEIEKVIKELDGDSLPLIKKVRESGIKDPQIAVSMLLTEEASQNLNIRRLLLNNLANGKAAIFLPLPPHILDMILPVARDGMVFNSEEKVPPHVEKYDIPQLDFFEVSEIIKKIEGVESLILDGQITKDNSIFIRRNVAYILEDLISRTDESSFNQVLLHKIPHIPKGQYFVELDVGDKATLDTI